MELLSYAFQFVRDVHVNITNASGGTAKLRQDYYIKKHAHNRYLPSQNEIDKIKYERVRRETKEMIRRSKKKSRNIYCK